MPEHATVTRPRARTAPIGPRRVSGPSRRAIGAGPAVRHRGGTSAFEKLSRIPDHRVVDRLLRGRACILIIGLMLGGIVAMQVSLLRLNSGISRAVQTQGTLEKQNMALQTTIAELTSSDRIIKGGAQGMMIDPPAGETRYLTAHPDSDAARAARRMTPPSERAKAITANHGILPGVLAAPGSVAAALAASLNAGTPGAATTGTAATTTQTPGAATTATPPATTSTAPPVATPLATPTPVATVAGTTPPVTTVPGTGAATAPQG
jgi:hypothetical protein